MVCALLWANGALWLGVCCRGVCGWPACWCWEVLVDLSCVVGVLVVGPSLVMGERSAVHLEGRAIAAKTHPAVGARFGTKFDEIWREILPPAARRWGDFTSDAGLESYTMIFEYSALEYYTTPTTTTATHRWGDVPPHGGLEGRVPLPDEHTQRQGLRRPSEEWWGSVNAPV